MSISRADKGGFANWWFTVDKVALTGMALLIGIGLMLAFAASPAITGGPLTRRRFSLCRAPAGLCGGGAGHHGGRLASVAAPGQDHGGHRLRPGADRILPGAVSGRRCAGRAARTQFRLHEPAAVGIPQAQLRHSGGRGAGRPRPDGAAQAGDHLDADHARDRDPAAAAGCRPDRPVVVAVGRDAVLRRPAAVLGGAAGGRNRGSGFCRLCDLSRMCITAWRNISAIPISAIRRGWR